MLCWCAPMSRSQGSASSLIRLRSILTRLRVTTQSIMSISLDYPLCAYRARNLTTIPVLARTAKVAPISRRLRSSHTGSSGYFMKECIKHAGDTLSVVHCVHAFGSTAIFALFFPNTPLISNQCNRP